MQRNSHMRRWLAYGHWMHHKHSHIQKLYTAWKHQIYQIVSSKQCDWKRRQPCIVCIYATLVWLWFFFMFTVCIHIYFLCWFFLSLTHAQNSHHHTHRLKKNIPCEIKWSSINDRSFEFLFRVFFLICRMQIFTIKVVWFSLCVYHLSHGDA